ncbi:MAG: hypothetical protein M3Q20_01265 [Actinomycetota bacterium]|nr:hypothetical protein [Actinomycetota bacterium]
MIAGTHDDATTTRDVCRSRDRCLMRRPSERSGSKPGRSGTWALAAGALVGATTVLYVWLIANQSPREIARVAVVVALFVLALAANDRVRARRGASDSGHPGVPALVAGTGMPWVLVITA